MELHQQLTEALDKRGITRTELAHKTGFAGSTITRLLDGKVERPSWPLIRAVCLALGINPLDLNTKGDEAA